jgi:hypothetical protein
MKKTPFIVAALALGIIAWTLLDPRFKADKKPDPIPAPPIPKEFTLQRLPSDFTERVTVFEGTHQQTGKKFLIITSRVYAGFSVAITPL